jgi:excisionase family DNA binding protein
VTELRLELPPELLEAIAQRVAAILDERQGADRGGYLDVEGAAEFLSCPPGRVYDLARVGRLPVHRDGRRLLFDREELRAYVRNGGAKRP